jgi:hypothetical protein
MSVSDQSSPELEALLRGLNIEISVGIHEDQGAEAHGEDGLTTAAIGAIHEFGLGVPQRSFVRGYFDERATEILQEQAAALQRILDGADPETEAGLLGLRLEGGMKERILARIDPPLSPATKARRGESAVPLVATSQLLGAVRSKVKVTK